eukprot:m.477857 g.477857  ORF g.477857 m.477857 type:complete len:50 (+) comp20964_c0_seq1:980-1129(+)
MGLQGFVDLHPFCAVAFHVLVREGLWFESFLTFFSHRVCVLFVCFDRLS